MLAADRARCFAKQVEAERAVMVQTATREDQPVVTLADVVPSQLSELPKCPSGGTCTLTWDAQRTPRVTCSKHGWRGDGDG